MDRKQITASFDAIRTEVQEAFDAIAKKHGLAMLRMGKITYTQNGDFHFKTEALFDGGKSKEAQLYEQVSMYEALPPLGTEVKYGPELFTPTGSNTTGTKILATKKSDGKTYLLPIEAFKQAWARQNGTTVMPRGLPPIPKDTDSVFVTPPKK